MSHDDQDMNVYYIIYMYATGASPPRRRCESDRCKSCSCGCVHIHARVLKPFTLDHDDNVGRTNNAVPFIITRILFSARIYYIHHMHCTGIAGSGIYGNALAQKSAKRRRPRNGVWKNKKKNRIACTRRTRWEEGRGGEMQTNKKNS